MNIERHRDYLENAAARYVGRNDAEDAVQETMITAYLKMDSFKGDDKALLSWLYTILKNKCRDINRKKQKVPRTISLYDCFDLPDTTNLETQFIQSYDFRLSAAKLNQVIQHCNLTPNEIYILNERLQDTPYKVIASHLQITENHARQLMYLLLTKARQAAIYLSDQLPDAD